MNNISSRSTVDSYNDDNFSTSIDESDGDGKAQSRLAVRVLVERKRAIVSTSTPSCSFRCGHPSMQDWLNIVDEQKHVILAASGSVATIKLPAIVRALALYQNISICIVLTANARRFFTGSTEAEQPSVQQLSQLPNVVAVLQDEDEWNRPWTRDAKILHIELRRWADMLVVAPLSANTLAKIVHGLCDNLLTNVIRAWDTTSQPSSRRSKPIVVAPAMNTAMWMHPLTAQQLSILESEWAIGCSGAQGCFIVLQPTTKSLACGDVGCGAMCEVTKVVCTIQGFLDLIS